MAEKNLRALGIGLLDGLTGDVELTDVTDFDEVGDEQGLRID